MRRGFSLIELMLVLAVIGLAMTAAFTSVSSIYEEARRKEQAKAALAQMKKVRADALASSSGAAIEAVPQGTGIKVTTATIPSQFGKAACEDWQARASKTVVETYDLLQAPIPRADNTLCFESGGFRLLADDGVSQETAALVIDLFPTAETETVTVAPSGSLNSTFDSVAIKEGLSSTLNTTYYPPVDDPSRNISDPGELEADIQVVDSVPPPDPTQPGGEPTLDPQPLPKTVVEPPPPGCVNDTDCLVGYFCLGGLCEPAGTGCVNNFDCAFDETCDLGSGFCVFGGCNTSTCPYTGTCGGCQGGECCTSYSCICY